MDWSTMIPDLLKRISDKLPHCFDYFNFRLVCAHWRSAARPKKFPTMLVLPSDSDSAELPFFDPSDGGVHFHPLPVSARNKMIRGASRGWPALMDVPTKSMSLVNPSTGGEFPLPPNPNELLLDFHDCDDSDLDSSLCGDVDGDGTCGHWHTEHYYIGDVVMSSAPNSGTECIVVAQEITRDQLCFCRPGDPKWTPIFPSSEIDLSCEIHGVAFWDGRFYAVDRHGKILVLEFGPPDNRVTVVQSFVPPFHSKIYKLLEWNGELLLFGVSMNDEAEPLIYKCDDPMGESLTWSKVDSLDEIKTPSSCQRITSLAFLAMSFMDARGTVYISPEPHTSR